MFRLVVNGGLQQYRTSIARHILYSTKVSAKSVYPDERKLQTEIRDGNANKFVEAIIDSRKHQITAPNIIGLHNEKAALTATDVAKLSIVVDEVKKKTASNPLIQWQMTPLNDMSKLINQYLMLSKIRLTTLVVITSMIGYALAPAPFEPTTFLLCTVGTGLCSAAANAINQYHEVPFDAQMSRTKNRVLVRGQLTPLHAINFAIASAAVGCSLLYFGVNGYTAALGAANLVLYTSIYTPMKRFSILNTWVGAIVGAIPPVMGWIGCSGAFEPGCLLMAGLLYTWQFPHFNALSWNLRPDYSRAGYRMMSVSHPALCRRVALRHTIGLTALCTTASYFDVTNIWFVLETLPLNLYFVYLAYKFYEKSDSGSSRKLFRYSLIQLPILMFLFFVNKKEWICRKESVDKMPAKAITTATEATTQPIHVL